MKFIGYLAMAFAALAVALVIAGQLGYLSGPEPKALGVTNGRLRPPSLNPNSVSSQAALYPDHPRKEFASIAPFKYTGDGEAAMARLDALLQKEERTVVVRRGEDYLYAQNTTAVLKFTDDMEFWLDKPNGVIQVRSASRLGRKDFNVNRARIEAIRARFEQ